MTDGVTVESSPRPEAGDFRLDLRPVVGTEVVPRSTADRLVQRLSGHPALDRVTCIPPRLYFRLRIEVLHDRITAGVLERPHRYGSGSEGGGRPLQLTFSDPNLNKPLHLGHLRNNVLGMALAMVLEARGYRVRTSELMSNWGIHTCQALAAYQRWGAGGTPEDAGEKGDHFVGRFYVAFHREQRGLQSVGEDSADAVDAKGTDLATDASRLLRQLEAGNESVRQANTRLTSWAEDGIRATYARLGTRIEATFREADHIPMSKQVVERGLRENVCARRPDESVCIDLDEPDVPAVTLLRSDGTQVIYARVLGAYLARNDAEPISNMLALLGREWEPPMQTLIGILRRLGYSWGGNIVPLHYGMVTSCGGRMRSREGDVVSADALLDRIREQLERREQHAGTWGEAEPGPLDAEELAVALVKYHFLGVKRSRDLAFDESRVLTESLPRLSRVISLAAQRGQGRDGTTTGSPNDERSLRALLLHVNSFPDVVKRTARELDPAILVHYLDGLGQRVVPSKHRGLPGPLRAAMATVIFRALDLLNIKMSGASRHVEYRREGSYF